MSVTYDFRISGAGVPGISLVMAQNEEAFSYLTDECDFHTLPDGSAVLSSYRLWDFIEDAERAQMCSALA